MLELSAFEVEMVIENLKGHKSPDIDQIISELIKAGVRTFRSEIHNHINSISSKEELPKEWKESIVVPSNKKCDKTIIIEVYHFCQLTYLLHGAESFLRS